MTTFYDAPESLSMGNLETSPLFSGIPAKELRDIEKDFQEVVHPAGKSLAVAGTGGVGFNVLLEGEVEVSIGDGRVLKLGPGEHFGEMALLDHGVRSADVVTLTEVKVVALPQWNFKAFLLSHPEVCYRLLESVSTRLRRAEPPA